MEQVCNLTYMNPRNIKISDYNYPLPDERIAKFPLSQRDQSKLLVYDRGEISHTTFSNIPDLLPKGALMVFNNTRVIQARLHFRRETGALIEVFLLEPYEPADYELMFQTQHECQWRCLVGNLKKWKGDILRREIEVDGNKIIVSAEHIGTKGTSQIVRLSWAPAGNEESRMKNEELTLTSSNTEGKQDKGNSDSSFSTLNSSRSDASLSFAELIDIVGELPIPPYLNRDTEESDKTTYQTVYSKIKGSVAAPPAGLHFTDAVLADIDAHGIEREELTLHVGAGTFRPVKSEFISGHDMHTEYVAVRLHTIERLLAHGCRAIAVGTTSVRTLESLYYIGCHILQHPDNVTDNDLHVQQWEPYSNGKQIIENSKCNTVDETTSAGDDITACQGPYTTISTEDALTAIKDYLVNNQLTVLHASTQIIIAPSYQYRIVSHLVTNFHQPQSTLLLLVSALVGDDWHNIYDYALQNGFRFLSYGDSSLLIPKNNA